MSSKHCIHTSLFSCHDDQYYKHPRATVNRHACPRRQLLPITGLSRRRSVSPRSESQYGYNSNTLFRRAMLCKRDAQCVSINLALMNVESLKLSMSTYEHQHFPNLGSKKSTVDHSRPHSPGKRTPAFRLRKFQPLPAICLLQLYSSHFVSH